MAAITFASSPVRRTSLATIDAVVSARLGPTRIAGNEQPACFNRQIAMYLARYVGGLSTTQIGRFYNGRDHSTVCYGIQRIHLSVIAILMWTLSLRSSRDSSARRAPPAPDVPRYRPSRLASRN